MSGSREESKRWLRRSAARIPGCAQTFSKSPISLAGDAAPSFLARAKGAHVWDVDGNRFIDYILGLGPVILGHADDVVNQAVTEQIRQGVSFSLPHTLEVELAELLCELIPCAEMVRFAKNGSDVTAAAVRVSRAFTGRDKVIRCGYHGWQDWYIGSTSRNRGVPAATSALTQAVPYNDIDAINRLLHVDSGSIACVIMEPVVFDIPAAGYLQEVRELCTRFGALLVFDEVITGFRIDLGGAQRYFGVTPDLACFGKGMANGFPLSAIVGRADVMQLFEEVFFSSTFGGETASLAASLATIRELRRLNGIAMLWKQGAILQRETQRLIEDSRIADRVSCEGLAPWTTIRIRSDVEEEAFVLRSLFQQEALRRGILTHGNHMLSLAHQGLVIDETLNAYREIFPMLADAIRAGDARERLQGSPVRPIIRA